MAGFLAVCVLSTLILSGWVAWYSFDLVDDTYITMVYAKNIADGHGIVFYPGGERIEGYTTPLWMFTLTLFALMQTPLPGVAFILSMLAGVLTAGMVFLIYRQRFHDGECFSFQSMFWPVTASLAVVSDVAFAAWSASGMETTAYTLFLLLLCYALHKQWTGWKVGIVLLVTALIRPEGVMFAAIVLLHGMVNHRSFNRSVIAPVLVLAIPYAMLAGLRYLYFGELVPNSFYAKHDFGGLVLIGRGIEYVYYFFRPRPFFLFALVWALAEKNQLRIRGGLLALFALLHTAIVVYEGGDHFTLHRFLAPVIPFLTILSVRGVALAIDRIVFQKITGAPETRLRMAQLGVAALMVILLIGHGAQLYDYKCDTRCGFSNGARYHRSIIGWTRNWAQVGRWLQEKYPPDTLIAVTNAGAIPFYCELKCIDMLGINDITIGRTPLKYPNLCYPGHERSNAGSVLSRKPVFIQLFPLLFFSSKPYPETELDKMITYPSQREMWQMEEFHRDYEYKTEDTRFGYISYFERKDRYDSDRTE